MLIIIEGPDGAGKSHLAQHIKQEIKQIFPSDDVQILHKGPPTSHPLDEYEKPLFHYRPGTSRHIICDRWHIGEWIYPNVFKRKTDADVAVWRHMDMFLASRGALLVYANPPEEVLHRQFRERGDDMVFEHQLNIISLSYAALMMSTKLPVMHYENFTDTTYARSVVERAMTHDVNTNHLNPYVTYVGPPRPQYVLLGDVRHDLRHSVRDMSPRETISSVSTFDTISFGPAFGPYRGTSGHFLLSHIPRNLDGNVGIVNACDVDNAVQLLHELGSPRAIALGANAYQTMRHVTNIAAPHPQYVRRFYSKHGKKYGKLILSALENERNELKWRP